MTPTDRAPTMAERIAAETLYRILDGPEAGVIVPETETCECDDSMDGCEGSGTVSVRYSGDYSGYDSYADGERECYVCGGSGRVLGYPDSGPPLRVELVAPVEAAPAERDD